MKTDPTTPICPYCGEPRESLDGWHGCKQSLAGKELIEHKIEAMTRIASGEEQLSEAWNPGRKKRLGDIAQTIRITGGQTKPMGGDDE